MVVCHYCLCVTLQSNNMLANTMYFVFDASKESVESRRPSIKEPNDSIREWIVPERRATEKAVTLDEWRGHGMIGLPSPAPTLLLSSRVASTSTHSSWSPPPLLHYLPNTVLQLPAIHLITSRCTLKLVKPVRMSFKEAIALHWTGVCLIKSCKRMQVLDLSVHMICMCVEYL